MSTRRVITANAKSGAALGVRIASVAFAVDAGVFAADAVLKGSDPGTTAVGVLLTAAVYGIAGVASAALLAPVAVYLGGVTEAGPRARAGVDALRRRLGSTEATACRAFAARSIAVVLSFFAAVAAAVPCTLAATVDIRTPLYSAALAAGVTLGAVALSAAAWPVWLRTGTLLSRFPPRIPRPALQLAFALFAAAGSGALLVAFTWRSFGFALPWRGTVLALALFAAGIAWFALDLGRRRPPSIARRALLAARVGLPIAGLAAAVFLPRSLAEVNAQLADASGPVSAVHELASRLLDFDGDGYLSILGQGDCAPFDRTRSPAARDIPNDGVDQNCTDGDRKTAIIVADARHDYPATPKPRPMPVVLVTIDSVSAADLDLYGAKRKTMPALARWARDAVVFDRAFAVGPSTRLSIPSLVTGKYLSSLRHKAKPRPHGAWAEGNVTLADVLGRAGYRTIAVAPDPYFSKTISWIYQGFREVIMSPAKGPPELTAPLVTDAALAALRETGGMERVFLWVHYNDAHWSAKDYTLPPGMTPFPGDSPKDMHDTKMLYIDHQIERLFAGLDEIFKDAPRLVIVTADHGESFDTAHVKKARARHAWDLTTSVTRIPLIVSSPYGGPRRTNRVANTIDIMPTVLNAVGLTARALDGDSLVPTLLTGADAGRPILQQMFFPEYLARGKDPLYLVAVRHRELALFRRGAVHSLYDYVRDPGEERNLAAERVDVVGDLAEIMQAMLDTSGRVDNGGR